eukprot:1682112-Pyramimonas_sp.AAC.1
MDRFRNQLNFTEDVGGTEEYPVPDVTPSGYGMGQRLEQIIHSGYGDVKAFQELIQSAQHHIMSMQSVSRELQLKWSRFYEA